MCRRLKTSTLRSVTWHLHFLTSSGWASVQRRTQYKTERIILPFYGIVNYRIVNDHACNKGVKEVDLYSAFIVVPHTQGAHVLITKCYLQITQYLPLPRKRSPDGASPRLRLQTSNCSLLLIYLPPKGWKAESALLADLQRTVYTQVVTHQLQVECRTGKVRRSKTDVLPLCHALCLNNAVLAVFLCSFLSVGVMVVAVVSAAAAIFFSFFGSRLLLNSGSSV